MYDDNRTLSSILRTGRIETLKVATMRAPKNTG